MSDLRKFKALARNWEAFGDDDPLYGVLSDPTKIGGKWDTDEFFASGRAHVKELMRRLADARAAFEPGTCLDFGCGVGRLTVPLSESFNKTIGVDVARAMIVAARAHRPRTARCEFVVNRDPHLRRFADRTFDVVHSCLVLQHIPPEFAARYIAEFFRVARPGGLVVFQVPAVAWTEGEITAAHALPDSGCAARLLMVSVPPELEAAATATVSVRVTNHGDVTWRHDLPVGRDIRLGNHWLREDGTLVGLDDGRALLPQSVEPGETVDIGLTVRAPQQCGRYILEVDLVQEYVTWFAQKGSPTARVQIDVIRAAPRPALEDETAIAPEPSAPAPRRGSVVRRLLNRLRGGTPSFEMHVLPREDVERVIAESGGLLLKAVDDNFAGPRWLSYTYICRRRGAASYQ